MLSGDISYEFLSGVEDSFGPKVYGGDVARLKPVKHFVKVGDVEIDEQTRTPSGTTAEPLTEEEIEETLKDLAWYEESGECGL